MDEQTLPCPNCAEQGKDTKIQFDPFRLVAGDRFACPVCGAEIGLASDSKPQIEKTLARFAEFKRQLDDSQQKSDAD